MSDDAAYLRFPHLHEDLVCFAAEDDIWVAPVVPEGARPGRAWRVTADRLRVGHPRFSPDGRSIAYTNWRSLDPEIHLAPVEGGPSCRLTYWGSTDTRVCGWSAPEPSDPASTPHILAVSSHGQPFSYYSWAYSVPTDGSPGGKLPWGPVSDIAVGDIGGERRTLLLTGKPPHEPADWKRYRGGATGRLWLHGERLLADLDGHLDCPMFVGDRIAFLSDHEGVGNLYSCLSDGTGLRRHTDHDAFYARHASSDGRRVVYQCAGDVWIVDGLAADSRPRRLDVRLGGPRTGRRTYQIPAAAHLGAISVDTTGRASAVSVRGSLYWLTHRDGPARAIADTPGVRVRLPAMLGSGGRVAYVTDAEGDDAVEIAYLPRASGDRPPRRLAAGLLGRVHEMEPDPEGGRVALSTHDGRLLLLDVTEDAAAGAGTLDMDTANPGTDATAPEAGTPAPGAGTPDMDTAAPDATHQEAGSPNASATAPGAGAPTPGAEVPGADTADSGATNPEAADPDAADPGVRTQNANTADPHVGIPNAGATGPDAPDAGSPAPDAAEPDATERDAADADSAGTDPGATGPDAPDADAPAPDAAAPKATEPEGTERNAAGAGTPLASPHAPGGLARARRTAGVTEVVRSLNGPVTDLAFSPDGDWITWSQPTVGRSLRQIRMARIGGTGAHTVVDVTDGRFEDENPVFTSDGRYLAFLSWRGFDPVYDVHTGDLSFPLGCRPYLVPLSSTTPSPFALSPEGRPAAGGLDPLDDDEAEGGAVIVEVEGLASRVTPFPVAASKYSSLHPVSGGGLVWLRWPISGALGETFVNPADTSGRPTLEHFDIAKARRSELVDHLDWFAPSGDGTRLVVVDDGELRVMSATDANDSDGSAYLDLRRILHDADPEAEWRQAFDEAGRIVRAYFWDPGMSGIDWDAVLDQYRPLVERVASPDEFADLLREALGELGTSHAYVSPARRDEGPPHYQRPMGLLGANLVCRDEGWMVKRILPGDSSDSRARSPLAGTGIREGALLTHVDGRPVDPVAGPGPLLSAAGGTTVELTFRTAAPAGTEPAGTEHTGTEHTGTEHTGTEHTDAGAPTTEARDAEAVRERPARRVAVVPLIDERPLRYQDWVTKRREVVRELSDGRCGYLHIPDMQGSGWAQFNRDLRREMSRPALIVDVRGNAGGHISELVVEKLSRRIIGWDLTRNAQPVSYASNAPRGPVVAIADEATSSDGDMITAAFRLLGLGPVVGQRTWGGVVGMTGRHRLGDGTVITVPMNAAWFDGYGWSVENHGVEPDIEALRTPLDWAEGRYAQLDDAVWVALDLLAAKPAAQPPGYQAVPDRRRPPLPPRPGR
ncbi:S41 family peptidase [Streptomyces montanisoli]|uniref:S41 family peptidase n=1 Tax=Streptomyces montanisoli TaxID=2798581 RepID=UPI0027DCE4D4|nr:S41 family peptidase [Streptomyces montanisoli]